jgi:hypothetical protein
MTYTLRRIDCSILNSTFFGSKLTFDLLFVKIAVLFRNIISLTSVFQHITSYFRLPKMLLVNIGRIYHCLVFVHVHVVCIVTADHLYIWRSVTWQLPHETLNYYVSNFTCRWFFDYQNIFGSCRPFWFFSHNRK